VDCCAFAAFWQYGLAARNCLNIFPKIRIVLEGLRGEDSIAELCLAVQRAAGTLRKMSPALPLWAKCWSRAAHCGLFRHRYICKLAKE
jgi:hypothetical protein